jgi:hypothetical protein
MKNNRGFGFLATLATIAGMLGYRNERRDPAPNLKADRAAPPSMRNTKRSCYSRHQGVQECARRRQQPFLCHVPNLAAALAQRPSGVPVSKLWEAA